MDDEKPSACRLSDVERSCGVFNAGLDLAPFERFTIRRTLDCLIASVCIREDVALLHADADFERLASCSTLRIA